jgi:hypothetical protein
MDLIEMVTQASTEEVKKLVSLDTNSTTAKREFDTVEQEKKEEGEPSKKK